MFTSVRGGGLETTISVHFFLASPNKHRMWDIVDRTCLLLRVILEWGKIQSQRLCIVWVWDTLSFERPSDESEER